MQLHSRGGTCSYDPLIFLDFIPCSPLIKPLVPKNVFSSCSLDPENFLRRSLDPQKCLSLFPIFVCLFYLSTHNRKNCFRTASFFSLRSAHAVLHWYNCDTFSNCVSFRHLEFCHMVETNIPNMPCAARNNDHFEIISPGTQVST